MEQIFKNARIVLPDDVITGTIVLRDGLIADVSEGTTGLGEDIEGDYILPGLIELHTDHLENHYGPRPGVRWHTVSALQAHDAQIAASGITTVFDCFRVGNDTPGNDFEPGEMCELALALNVAQAQGRLRSDHLIHLRCEVSAPNATDEFDSFLSVPNIRLVSLMDHAPGQRQFQTMDQYTLYYKTKRGLSDEAFARFVQTRVEQSQTHSRPNRSQISAICRERGIALASHDDATLEHVDEAIADGVSLAEFPTSVDAARASHEKGLSVLMGAPNVVRGRSHSGNIAARDLADLGLLDVLSSDYVPMSLIHAPFILADAVGEITLPDAIAMVTGTPAKSVGLTDRGTIEPGKRADVLRVHRPDESVPVVRSVWREGRRVA